MTRLLFVPAGAAAIVAIGVAAAGRSTVLPVSSEPVPVIVELFTSEGCSSCPPADQVLMELQARQPVAGARVIALSEHVDYWDRLGWKDPFSSAQLTQRQTAYSLAKGGEVYTPQMFVDGGAGFVGSDRSAAIAAITHAAAQPKPRVTLSLTSQSPTALSIVVGPAPQTANASVWMAIVEDGLRSSVARGENSGRTLQHSSVTRLFTPLGKTNAQGGFERTVPLTLDAAWKRDQLHAIVVVQPAAVGKVAAAGSIALARGSHP